MKGWQQVKPEALRKFVECTDGRLYHPVIAEKALEAWSAKLAQRARTAAASAARAAKKLAEEEARNAGRDDQRNVERDDRPDPPSDQRYDERHVDRDGVFYEPRDVVQGTGTGTVRRKSPSQDLEISLVVPLSREAGR